MPLNKPVLKAGIIALLTAQSVIEVETQTPEQAIENYAAGMSDLIDAFVRSGTVETTGSSTAQVGFII